MSCLCVVATIVVIVIVIPNIDRYRLNKLAFGPRPLASSQPHCSTHTTENRREIVCRNQLNLT
jgi:hypothetical protein